MRARPVVLLSLVITLVASGRAVAGITGGDHDCACVVYWPWSTEGLVGKSTQLTSDASGWIDPQAGDRFVHLNQPAGGNPGQSLSENHLRVVFEADDPVLQFHWSRLQTDFAGDGGTTFQVELDLTDDNLPPTVVVIDAAPDGSTLDQAQSWHAATIPGLTVGGNYEVTFQAGYSDGLADPSGTLIYAIDEVDDVPLLLPWQNPAQPLDVNDDSFVSPIDALQVINRLNAEGAGQMPPPTAPSAPPPYYDVNGDGHCSPIDALQVINHLNATAAAEGAPTPVPEPGVLAALVAASLALLTVRQRHVGHVS